MYKRQPFYVIGLVAYEKLKKAATAMKRKDLTAWETIGLGGLSGAIAAAATTPADVLKTRAMTGASPAGEAIWVTVKNIIAKEGGGALMKGCFPRMLWIAPLGAMNFAGYELAKRAMEAADEPDAQSGAKGGQEMAIKIEAETERSVPIGVPTSSTAPSNPAPVLSDESPSAEATSSDGEADGDVERIQGEEAVASTPSYPETPPASATPPAPTTSGGFRSLPPAPRSGSSPRPPPVER